MFSRRIISQIVRSRVPSPTCCLKRAALCVYCNNTSVDDLVKHHQLIRSSVPATNCSTQLNPNGVFTNSELRLSDIEVIGFDYDYTLAPYSKCLEQTIFSMIIEGLVTSRHYPSAISDLKYDPNFLARGTHYDIHTGIFMKVDAYHRIQSETVHHCFRRLSEEEISQRYPGRRLFFSKSGDSQRYRQIVDIFQIPELFAWCSVLDYLQTNQSTPSPALVFEDIRNVTTELHMRGTLHAHIMDNIERYLEPSPLLGDMLRMLREQNKQLFVLTNSPYQFVNAGMTHIIGSDWKQYFDVVICQSKKPTFFEDKYRVFRKLTSHNTPAFGEARQLKKGEIYYEGNVRDLHRLTGWQPSKILYFGDQMYADLAEPVLNQGWHTGAIIRELDEEIQLLNSEAYQRNLHVLMELNYLVNEMQRFLPDPTALHYTELWCTERKQVRSDLRNIHTTQFGSTFRTHLTPTLFYRRLSRFAEIYMSELTNLAHYNPSHHRFMPVRQELPHEVSCKSQLVDLVK